MAATLFWSMVSCAPTPNSTAAWPEGPPRACSMVAVRFCHCDVSKTMYSLRGTMNTLTVSEGALYPAGRLPRSALATLNVGASKDQGHPRQQQPPERPSSKDRVADERSHRFTSSSSLVGSNGRQLGRGPAPTSTYTSSPRCSGWPSTRPDRPHRTRWP